MFDLRKTDTGIYYLHDYIPVRQFDVHTEEEVNLSRMIWNYKNFEPDAIKLFTNELMKAITLLPIKSNKIGLVAVPPSKVNKKSIIGTSIKHIQNWYNQDVTKNIFNYYKYIYDYSELLIRSSDISTAHEGKRASYDEQKASITCTLKQLSRYWTTFILLDDVTTLGTSMDVCRDILIENGAKEKYIYRMAIAKTVR